MWMRNGPSVVLFSLPLLLGAFGCSDPAGPRVADLAGTWDAISAVATNPARPSQTADILASGVSFRLIIAANGAVETRLTVSGRTAVEMGSISLERSEVTLVLDGDPVRGTFQLRSDTLTLDLRTGIEWDFEEDGLDEPATLLMVMVRQ